MKSPRMKWRIALAVFLLGATGLVHAARADEALDSPPAALPSPDFEIAEHGRLVLDASALPTNRGLQLRLKMNDSARGSGDRAVRIVSLDGRKLDATAKALPGSGTGLYLEMAADFAKIGKYLIQVDTAERHSLSFRRYVLEIR